MGPCRLAPKSSCYSLVASRVSGWAVTPAWRVGDEQESLEFLSYLHSCGVLLLQLPGNRKLSFCIWEKSAVSILTGHCCSC